MGPKKTIYDVPRKGKPPFELWLAKHKVEEVGGLSSNPDSRFGDP